jgi:hypothetical protein
LKVHEINGVKVPRAMRRNSALLFSTSIIKNIEGSCLYQIPVPESMVSKTYGDMYKFLSERGIIPMGLLRGTFRFT